MVANANCKLILVPLAILCCAMSCRSSDDSEKSIIDPPALGDNPAAQRPKVVFPPEWQQPDKSFNDFVQKVLDTCYRGDYDGFCQLLATNETPPGQDKFKKIWHGVAEITIRSIRPDDKKPPNYYVHAIARLRQPDAEKRTHREVVLCAMKEMDHWRITGASKDKVRLVLMADSQPASGPEADAHGNTPGSAAPTSRPSGYKKRH